MNISKAAFSLQQPAALPLCHISKAAPGKLFTDLSPPFLTLR